VPFRRVPFIEIGTAPLDQLCPRPEEDLIFLVALGKDKVAEVPVTGDAGLGDLLDLSVAVEESIHLPVVVAERLQPGVDVDDAMLFLRRAPCPRVGRSR
jgi:hypothetical protein